MFWVVVGSAAGGAVLLVAVGVLLLRLRHQRAKAHAAAHHWTIDRLTRAQDQSSSRADASTLKRRSTVTIGGDREILGGRDDLDGDWSLDESSSEEEMRQQRGRSGSSRGGGRRNTRSVRARGSSVGRGGDRAWTSAGGGRRHTSQSVRARGSSVGRGGDRPRSRSRRGSTRSERVEVEARRSRSQSGGGQLRRMRVDREEDDYSEHEWSGSGDESRSLDSRSFSGDSDPYNSGGSGESFSDEGGRRRRSLRERSQV